ncbi:hypothetical protein [Corallococcus exercitus]|uniref:hypothetical protein n=1 Tax=Corallococcus exercitus TaxID=2316736 RepID=UPI0035D4EE14
MSNWLDVISRYVTQREALAEAILVEALRSQRVIRRFQEAIGTDLRWNLRKVTSQEWSANREARHDIVLTSDSGRQVRIELKGDAPFTKRQTKALRLGKQADNNTRIDVLIMPSWRQPPKQLGDGVKIIHWEAIDGILGSKTIGSLAGLWLGSSKLASADLVLGANQYMKYWETKRRGLTWRNLWLALQFIRARFSPRLQFSKIDGSKSPGKTWYYGVSVSLNEKRFWLGWVFRVWKHRQIHLSLIALEDPKGIRLRGAELQPYFGTTGDDDRMVKLWERGPEEGVLDLLDICKLIGKCCGIRPSQETA